MIPTVPTGRTYTSHQVRAVSLLAACTCLVVLIVMMCGVAEAADYDTITVTSANCQEWSTNLSNNDSTVTNYINVEIGAMLNLINATIRMKNVSSINVQNGATMDLTDGSTITRHDSGYYNFNYNDGSYGNLSASTIEYSYRLQIATKNNITITGCTISNNRNHGIHLTSDSGYVNITDCTIENTVRQYGIFIDSSQYNILRNNSLNNNSRDYSLYVTGDYYDQDIDTTNTVNGGLVYYNYSDSGTITGENNIGHVTIANCSDLWFTGCTIQNGDGVRIVGSSSSGISGSTIENNAKHGVYFTDSGNNTINDSHILDNIGNGIYSDGTSNYSRIINNSVNNNSEGIRLDGNGYNNITDNNISENHDDGIFIGSGDNIIRNNTILSNSAAGVTFYSDNNDLSENTISGNRDFALQFVGPYYNNYIWRNNTANGEEVNYYYDEHEKILDPKYLSEYNVSNVGKITLINCTNITIRDSELSNNIKSGYGIFLWNSNNNNLTNNTISNNYNGIRLHDSSSNNITDLQTTNPSNEYGAFFESFSDYNNIIDCSFAATNSHGLWITSSNHTTLINIMISSVNSSGLVTNGAHYTDITNATIVTTEADGADIISSDHVTIIESGITANNTGIHFTGSNHTDLINNIVGGEDGIHMSESHWGNLTNNTIDATLRGIFLTTSGNHNLTANNITNYTSIGILLEEYSTNTTMIGNDLTRNGAEFDIRINDSNGAAFTNNESTAANYIFYLSNDTRLCTLDTVFDKTKVGYEDTSNLTLMWRIDVLCLDNFHQEPMWTNLTVRYRDISDYNESLCWEGETSNANGRLSNNAFGDYGPPTSNSNWLPVIEYKQNASKKTTYQPMNCSAVNRWDVFNKIYGKSYKNITAAISGPGVTILVDAGHTPNGKCYYCHIDKLRYADGTFKFLNTTHWIKYNESIMDASQDDPYTPGQCIDCHNETDSTKFPHGTESGKDLLYYPSPQLCYTGRTGGLECHS
ncbi:MAG: hypothetical protein GQ469_06050, partial [Methanosarcinales archaeon]|nr:hypothetical protein [Methanosarcinales archaeon]